MTEHKVVEVLSIETTLEEIREEYTFDENNCTENGVGNMDGKPLYFLFYHHYILSGFEDGSVTDENGNNVSYCELRELEIKHIPGLREDVKHPECANYIKLWTDNEGFWHYEIVSQVPEDATPEDDGFDDLEA